MVGRSVCLVASWRLTEAHAAHLIQSLEKDVAALMAEDWKRDSDAAAREAKHNSEIGLSVGFS